MRKLVMAVLCGLLVSKCIEAVAKMNRNVKEANEEVEEEGLLQHRMLGED